MPEMHFTVPFPPSSNQYYRTVVIKGSGRTMISKRGRQYTQEALRALSFNAKALPPITGRVELTVYLCAPNKLRRDLDNFLKPLLDVITRAEIWKDDSQIDDLHVIRGETGKPGHANLIIRY